MTEIPTVRAKAARTTFEVEAWLADRLAQALETDRREIDVDEPLAHYALDSLQFVLFVTDLESWLGIKFTENPLHDDTSVRRLAQELAAKVRPS